MKSLPIMNNYIRSIFFSECEQTFQGKRIKLQNDFLKSSAEKTGWKWKRKCVPFYMPTEFWTASVSSLHTMELRRFLSLCLLFPVRRFSIFTSIFFLPMHGCSLFVVCVCFTSIWLEASTKLTSEKGILPWNDESAQHMPVQRAHGRTVKRISRSLIV